MTAAQGILKSKAALVTGSSRGSGLPAASLDHQNRKGGQVLY